MRIPFILMIVFAGLLACSVSRDTGTCETIVTAKDMTGLDGCGMLLELTDGTRLLPSNVQDFDLALKDGEVYKIEYKVLSDMASICMAEDLIVKLECLKKD